MVEVCLVRHGETEWNRLGRTQGGSDIPLNDSGRQQAISTGSVLARFSWDALYASPLSRAMETAEIISGLIDFSEPIRSEPGVMERYYGSAEGMSIAEREATFGHKHAIPDAEPWEMVKARGVAALERIAERHWNQRVLVIAHGGLISSILAVITDGEYTHRSGPLKNAGATLITTDGSTGWRVLWYNRDASDFEEIANTEGVGEASEAVITR